ncbi:MAG: 50S ribosomal protein L4 [Pyrinomonadaceae bacterium]|nr:50S ribosomal protein L4 [Pyrinomonadaceae bacterium]
MPTVKVRNLKNEEVGEVELSDAVFDAPFNEALIHAAVRNYMANGRQGTSATKTRGDVSGSGRKLWKQKGTGRARIASIRSPLWKGGGNVHGPQPRDWSYNMPKKMRQGALRSALSERVREGRVILVDGWQIDKPKTKDFVASLKGLGHEGKTLIVDSLDNENLMLSTRNVRTTKVVNSFALNIYDLLYHEKLIISEAAVKELEQLLGPKKDADATEVSDGEPAEEKVEAASAEADPAEAASVETAPVKPKRVRKPKAEVTKAAEPAESEAEVSEGGDEK